MARRFEFRLETLLRLRQLQQREAKRKVGAKLAEIALVDRLNRQTASEIARQQRLLLAGQQQRRLDPLALQRGRAWVAHLRHTIGLRQARRTELVTELRELQAAWQRARTAEQIVQKLRERRWREYLHDQARQEQAATDELAQQLHGYQP